MDTIGQALKKARENKAMTVADVALATKAMEDHIKAIEDDNFDVFPAPVYARGFIKLYAECVGLNPQPLVQAYRSRKTSGDSKLPPVKKMPPVNKARVPEPVLSKNIHMAKSVTERSFSSPFLLPPEYRAAFRRGLQGVAESWKSVLEKIRWPAFRERGISMAAIRLPVETWKSILAFAGMVLLLILAVIAVWWYVSWKNGEQTSSASRWLQEPPAPYVTVE